MVLTRLYDDPFPSMKPCPSLQPHCCSGEKTSIDNTNGNLPTSILEVSKPFIFRYENPKIFMIIEPACGSHENPSSSNCKMPD